MHGSVEGVLGDWHSYSAAIIVRPRRSQGQQEHAIGEPHRDEPPGERAGEAILLRKQSVLEFLDAGEGPIATCRHQPRRVGVGQAANLAQAEPNRVAVVIERSPRGWAYRAR